EGIKLERTQVGDRNVVECMRRDGFNVGGEQSGHIILSDFSTTGDGLVSALQVLAEIVRSGKLASKACRLFEPVPQLLKNVRYGGGDPLSSATVQQAIESAETALKGKGRLLVRKSGTEPLVRVMAEGDDQKQITQLVDGICSEIEAVA
ncbi:MAG: phosphoglucosamine mutase, partial [Kordiimonadaceae bacterium]|nr:phosphoglucosamine mutase [Kordiimonadaceae bacterium]